MDQIIELVKAGLGTIRSGEIGNKNNNDLNILSLPPIINNGNMNDTNNDNMTEVNPKFV